MNGQIDQWKTTNVVRQWYQVTQTSKKGGCEEDLSIRKKNEVVIKTFENNFCKNSLVPVDSLIILKSDSSIEAAMECFSVSAMQERCSNNSIYNPDVQKSGLSYVSPVQFTFAEQLKACRGILHFLFLFIPGVQSHVFWWFTSLLKSIKCFIPSG